MVLLKHPASYSRCRRCFAVQADDPTWLADAYSTPIAARDIGLVSRNVDLAKHIRRTLAVVFPRASSFLDFGAGNGMFVRLMRDRGYDFGYFDRYGPNLFAKGFERDIAMSYEVMTALEVVEHLMFPVEEIRPFVAQADGLIISTELVPEDAPPLESWWYYSLESGQHITIFSREALRRFAEALGFQVKSVGSLHVLSRRPVPDAVIWLLRSRLALLLDLRARRRSLLPDDFEALFGQTLAGPERPRR
jgi:hypothetical protein